MRRYFSTLLGICLLASVNGCVTTAVGGGTTATTGTYSYFTRELSVIYALPLADVWIRALAAVESLQLHIDRQLIDGLGGDIEARRPDGTKVWVHLKPSGDHSTRRQCAHRCHGRSGAIRTCAAHHSPASRDLNSL